MKNIFKPKQQNEQALIKRLIQGDSSAFDQVVADYHNIMLSVARAIVGEAFADEVVQDAWISAIKALPKFEGRSSLKTWLLHIVSDDRPSNLGNAFMAEIQALPKFEGRSSLKTWLLHIVSNGAKSRVRRENRHTSLDEGWESVDPNKFDQRGHLLGNVDAWDNETPEAVLANQQLQTIIEQTFRQLPAMQRAALSLYDMEGVKMEEVCNILDITASNARVLLHRARTTLHHSIDKYQEGK